VLPCRSLLTRGMSKESEGKCEGKEGYLIEFLIIKEIWSMAVDEGASGWLSTKESRRGECTNKASPSDQLYEKSCTSTSLYGSVFRWHQSRRPSFAERPSSLWS
jgi:hypothetical protein